MMKMPTRVRLFAARPLAGLCKRCLATVSSSAWMLVVLLAFAEVASASCQFPDMREPSEAPEWICRPLRDGYDFLAVGDKSHMPSVSLQNRLAGKDAMAAVARQIDQQAVDVLQQLAGVSLELKKPAYESAVKQLQKIDGVMVLDKAVSSRRWLYVLAGMSLDNAEKALSANMALLMTKNRQGLIRQLGQAGYDQLNERALHYRHVANGGHPKES